jgi:hypothetical protein
MQLAHTLVRWLCLPAMVLLLVFSMPRCSKNAGPNDNKKDSTDTLPKKIVYDSAVFYVSMDIWVYNTSGVYTDTFSDGASMKIYIVNGVMKFDSIHNQVPVVYPSSGSNGFYKAVWIPDDIGEINITRATGLAIAGDTLAAISLTQTGCVSPKWQLTAIQGGTTTTGGGEPSPGWPLVFDFKTNVPPLTGQDAFKLVQQGSEWYIWVYRDY